MAVNMANRQLFISHISKESALAQVLKERLLADFAGHLEVFVSSDRSSIGAGTKWLDEVDQALKQADLVVVMASPESVTRPWVNFEAGAVWLRGTRLIPACHSGMTPATLPTPLNMLQAIDFADATGLQKLYDAVAAMLGKASPKVNFDAMAQRFAQVVAEYQEAWPALTVVHDPQILCIANTQYSQPAYGFKLDVAALRAAFPRRVTVLENCTRKQFLGQLADQRYDIVYLVTPMHPETGAMVFSPVDAATNIPVDVDPEVVPPDRLSRLLVESQTRLLVFATCRALLPAVELATVANIVATEQDVTGEQTAAWAECFFGLLAKGRSVYKAFELTRMQVDTPMRLVRQADMAFALGKPTAEPAAPSAQRRQAKG
jgi:hypothetical protein